MEKFMEKYSVWFTTALGIFAVVFLIINWNATPMLKKIVLFYMISLACHEWEELKLPGGFVELVLRITGFKLKKPGSAKLALFIITLYATILPFLFYDKVFLVLMPVLVGIVEIIAHLLSAKVNPEKKFYSPGMITAVFIQFPVAVFGLYYLIKIGELRVIHFLWAALLLFIPLLGGQAMIVKSNGMKYKEFINNARKTLLKKEK